MKNKLLILTLLSAVFLNTNAQFIENNMHVQFSCGLVNTLGNKNTKENDFVIPSLYANYSKGTQLSFRATYKLKPAWSVGIEYNQTKFDNWEYGAGEDLFNNSSSRITSGGVLVKIHTRFRQEGIYNKLQLYAIVGPSISKGNLTLQEPIFSMPLQDQIPPGEIKRNSTSWGMNASSGFIYSVTQRLSLLGEGGLLVSRVESQLHNDKFLKAIHLNVGLCVQLLKAKRFY